MSRVLSGTEPHWAINSLHTVVCPTCGNQRTINYSNYRRMIRLKTKGLCQSCRLKINPTTFHRGHRYGVRFGNDKQSGGDNHWNWKGGITSKNSLIRNSKEYRKWRKAVFERNNYTCIECGQHGGTLNADHIKPFALFPKLRLSIENGRTLCKPCHLKIGWTLFRDNNPRKNLQLPTKPSNNVTSIKRN